MMQDRTDHSPEAATRAFVRHTIATLAYRGTKILEGVPEGFGETRAADPATKTRSAREILAHTADLLDWTALLVAGRQGWRAAPPTSWADEVGRFYAGLKKVDDALLTTGTPAIPFERIFQGPIADALTHLGQLALLRRLAGSPKRGEVMILSEVTAGRVGPDQAAPVREFD